MFYCNTTKLSSRVMFYCWKLLLRLINSENECFSVRISFWDQINHKYVVIVKHLKRKINVDHFVVSCYHIPL